MTQLDDVVSFLTKAGTLNCKHIEDAGLPHEVGTGNRILVYTGGATAIDTNVLRYTETYQCATDFDTEANLVTMKETLIGNCDKVNRREAIAGYTKPAKLINVHLVDWDPPSFNKISGRIRNKFMIRIEWSTA